jgi:hypothetical protein
MDELGLHAAVLEYAKGFEARSGIQKAVGSVDGISSADAGLLFMRFARGAKVLLFTADEIVFKAMHFRQDRLGCR